MAVGTVGSYYGRPCNNPVHFHQDVFINKNDPNFVSVALTALDQLLPSCYKDDCVTDILGKVVIPKCDLISIEFPYYDSDFNSTYYRYHVKKFRQCRKECCRLIFYRNRYDEPLQQYICDCVGYISLRPIANGNKIGRTYLDPTVFFTGDGYIICGKYKIHYEGEEELVQAMPYMKQEGDIAVCAHVCLWSAIRFFSSRFPNCTNLTMGEIVDRIMSPQERKIPSHGLTSSQISALFLSSGFSSIILKRDDSNEQVAKLSEQLLAYIDSGIPVICVSQMLKHAIIACGRTNVVRKDVSDLFKNNEFALSGSTEVIAEEASSKLFNRKVNVIMESALVKGIVVNDDNELPYNIIEKLNIGNKPLPSNRFISTAQIDYCIIPLYKRMLLSYSAAKDLALRLYDREDQINKNAWRLGLASDDDTPNVVKLNLVSSNTFKEWIRDAVDCQKIDYSFLKLCEIPYPRFLWLAEISTISEYKEDQCSGFIVLDSTCSASDNMVCVALANNQKCIFYDNHNCNNSNDDADAANLIHYEKKFQIPLFRKNYIEVRNDGQNN